MGGGDGGSAAQSIGEEKKGKKEKKDRKNKKDKKDKSDGKGIELEGALEPLSEIPAAPEVVGMGAAHDAVEGDKGKDKQKKEKKDKKDKKVKDSAGTVEAQEPVLPLMAETSQLEGDGKPKSKLGKRDKNKRKGTAAE